MSRGIGLGQSLGSVWAKTTSELVPAASGYYFDFRTPAGYTLSGSNVLTLVELVTSTSLSVLSTQAVFESNGLNGGPCINFTNDSYTTNLAGLVAAAVDNALYSVILFGSLTGADAARDWCEWTGTTAVSSVGQATSGAGRKRFLQTNDAGSTTNCIGSDTPDTNHHIYRYEKRDGGASFSCRFYTDGIEDSGGAVSLTKPTTLTPTAFTVGSAASSCRIQSLVVIPGAPDTAVNEAIEATL